MAKLIGQIPKRLNTRYVATVIVLALVYTVAAKLGLSFAFDVKQVTTIWPPTGIALAALFLFGYRYWPGITLGAFVANALANEPLWVAGLIALGNTTAALVGAYVLNRIGFKPRLERFKDVFGLTLAGLATPLISATLGSFSLMLGQLIPQATYRDTWLVWWIGDMAGIMVFGSLILALSKREYLRNLIGKPSEAGLFLATIFAVSMWVFTVPEPTGFLLFPLMVWGALRFRQAGVVMAGFVVTLTSVWATIHGLGMFSFTGSVESNLFALHTYLFTLLATSLILASAVSTRDRSEHALLSQAKELESERRRVLKEIKDREAAEEQLKEANERITNILAGIIDESAPRREKAVAPEESQRPST